MKCSELTQSTPVVFKTPEGKRPMNGHVLAVLPKARVVVVSWLEGWKGRNDDIPYEDMIAAYDPSGEMMRFESVWGRSVLLTAE